MKLNPSSPEGCDAVPYMRYGHSASAIGDLVYIFGGRNDTHGACKTLFCFDTGEQQHINNIVIIIIIITFLHVNKEEKMGKSSKKCVLMLIYSFEIFRFVPSFCCFSVRNL